MPNSSLRLSQSRGLPSPFHHYSRLTRIRRLAKARFLPSCFQSNENEWTQMLEETCCMIMAKRFFFFTSNIRPTSHPTCWMKCWTGLDNRKFWKRRKNRVGWFKICVGWVKIMLDEILIAIKHFIQHFIQHFPFFWAHFLCWICLPTFSSNISSNMLDEMLDRFTSALMNTRNKHILRISFGITPARIK